MLISGDILGNVQHEERALTFQHRFDFSVRSSQYSSLKSTVHRCRYFQKRLSFVTHVHRVLETYHEVNG